MNPAAPVGRLKGLNIAEYARLSSLLDESFELDSLARVQWLERLQRDDPEHAALLRVLLTTNDAAELDSFLENRSLLERYLASFLGAEPELVGRRLGPYRVLSLLGHGGMGSVWLAERVDGLFARQVALKLVHPTLMGRATTERFAREREILASLNHPNIARLFDAGIGEHGQPYLALQYVVGTALTVYCDNHALPVRERLQLFLQVLSAVQYAHAHLVIHRDLKPSNILVTDEGQVELLDFGIAKLLTSGEAKETELTHLGGRAFTPDYASPEQIIGGSITIAADVYSLGVILYELLTGERPYRLKRDSRGALEEAILQAEPMAPSQRAPDGAAAHNRASSAKKLSRSLRGDLDTIVLKALKKTPVERYATVNAFSEDIERYLKGEVVLAQRDRLAYRALKFARRHRTAIAAGIVLVLTLGAGLAGTAWQAHVARQQADRAAAVQAFLIGLFDAADPNNTQGREVTVRELLDRGDRDLQSKLAQQPQLRIALDGVLVDLYATLGEDKKALPLAEARRALALEWAGPQSIEYGDALYALAQLNGSLGRNEVAEQTYRQAAAVFRHYATEREGELLLIERGRAFALIQLHRAKEARELLLAALPKLEKHFGALSWELAQGRAHLAVTYAAEGDHVRAAEVYDLLEPILSHPPVDHALDAATLRNNQGYSLWLAGRFDAAERSIRMALSDFDRLRGPNNSSSVTVQRGLGAVLMDAGRFAEAAAVFDANGGRAVAYYGAHEPETALNQSWRVASLIIVGRTHEAELIGRQALADAEAKPGLTAAEVGSVKRRLALALIFSDKSAEAEELLRQITLLEQNTGDASERHATTLLYRAGAQTALRNFEAAAELARQSANVLMENADSAVLLGKAQLTEALAYAYSQDPVRARAAVIEAETNLRRRLKSDHPDFLLLQLVQAEAQRAEGHPRDADGAAHTARALLESTTGARLPVMIPLIF